MSCRVWTADRCRCSTNLETISVYGLGRVGLVTAVCYAKKGCRVIGIESDQLRLEQIRRGNSPFYEPGLTNCLAETIKDGSLVVTNTPSLSSEAKICFVTVGTPNTSDGSVNLNDLRRVLSTIAMLRQDDRRRIVVVKSTVPPGTTRHIVKPILERETRHRFGLCYNPEFLREGSAIHDAEFPDRIIIGGEPLDSAVLAEFYKKMHEPNLPKLILTNYENAELIKYANNAFLATKVSFINCIAGIAERIPNADIKTVADAIGLDQRIGSSFLNAGLGWGGSCLPKDLQALVTLSKRLGHDPKLIEAVIETNREQRLKPLGAARRALGALKGKRVAVLGLAFKPNTDDLREAASIFVIRGLVNEGADVVVYDPVALQAARLVFDNAIEYASNAQTCLDRADCCIVVTEWDEFRSIPPAVFVERMRRPIVIDGRRIYDANEFIRAGIQLVAVGLGPSVPD